ncbi:MAG: choline monooxygenase [Euryarchaeota archaeon]|nr:choline monooxygenase [Euryarchaeota archaeon]|tara:strand:- start:934 stop:1992 length:1059 start_codon:yes stop_codon:yes gene_type:complete
MAKLIDKNIELAETLPSEYYTNKEIFADIKSKIVNMWHFSAHEDQLSEKNIIPILHSKKLMNESIILTRDGVIKSLSNVCTHRGMLVNTEPTKSNTLRCKYHGRTFDLNGCIKNMPKFEGVVNFPQYSDNLVGFSTMRWKGLLFTSLKERMNPEWIQFLEDRIGWLDIESFTHDSEYYRSYTINANWALYVDNYLEGFHIPYVHSGLNEVLSYDDYETEIFENGVLQIGIAKGEEDTFDIPEESKDYGKKIAAYYFWIFPGLMLNFYPWGLSVNLVVPLSVNKTEIIYQRYVGNSALIGDGAGGDLDKVEKEDQEIVEAVQIGVSSSSYDRGRYSPSMEKGVHYFHRILTEL